MIGILGGTFDPVHFGHLRPALDCLQELSLDQVRFVPLKVAVHRQQPQARPELRLAMLEAAIAGQSRFVVDPRELKRQGDSFSYDTLVSLRDDFGSERSLCLLVGTDAFAGFLSWHRPIEILEMAHLIVMCRPNHDAVFSSALQALYAERACKNREGLVGAPAGRILLHPVTQIEISSTRVRRLIHQGLSPRYLLPEAVLTFIEEHGLYR